MREYKKPEIQIVNLKSSEDIALTFDDIESNYITNYTKGARTYAVTGYAVRQSAYNAKKIEEASNG